MMVQMTQTNITDERRAYIKSVVINAYLHFNKPKLPLEIKSLTRSYANVRLISYSKQIRQVGDTYYRLTGIAKDAYTDYYANVNMYYIYYNDIDRNIIESNRYRWNIAHELGHVLLGHLSENDKTRILRSKLSDLEYDELEEEADYFAQLILVPHAPLLCFGVSCSNNIKYLCKISGPAANRRYYEFADWKAHRDLADEYDKRIYAYYYNFIHKKKCKKCGVGIIQIKKKYCPICGSKNTLQWGDGDAMKYPLLETYENGKLRECPNCHNEETNIEGSYCQICGKILINRCSEFSCSNNDSILPSNARYCPACGSNSIFFNAGILKPWNYNEYQNFNGFMDIPDDIYGEESFT